MIQSNDSSPPWGTTTKALVATTGLLLGVLVIWRFQSLIAPLIIALILAYLLQPLIRLLESRTGLSRVNAVLLVYLFLLLIWIGGGVALGFVIIDQVTRLIAILPELIPRTVVLIQDFMESWSARTWSLGPYTLDFGNFARGINLNVLADQASNLVRPVVNRSGTLILDLVEATLSSLSLGLLIIVVSIYVARDLPRAGALFSDLAHQPGYRKDADRLMADIANIWNAYLRGQVILALVIGIVVSITMVILRVRYALALGLVSGVLEFLPIIGPTVGTITAVLVAIFQGGNPWGLSPWVFALIVAAAMFIIQQVENNVLVPRIVSDALDLHPLVVMVSVVMGASLAGVLGAVLAAPVVASIKLLGGYAWRKMLDLPPFPEPPASPSTPDATVPVARNLLWHQIQARVAKLLSSRGDERR